MELANSNPSYERAKKKVREIRGFYINLACYLLVIPVLAFVNLRYSPEFYWFLFSATGWGFGLIVHGINAFGKMPFFGKAWEERKIKQIMQQEIQKHNHLKSQHGK